MMRKHLRLTMSVLAAGVVAAGCADRVPTRSDAVPEGPSASTFVNISTVVGAGGSLFGVNSAGLMVGFIPVAGVPRAYAYSTALGSVTLPTLNAGTKVIPARDTAFGVNRQGQVVGTSNNAAGVARPVLWNTTSSPPQDLGTSGPGYALDINNDGMVVGWWHNTGSTFLRAFVWTAAGGFVDPLGPSQGGKARGVNDDGVVVGEVNVGGVLRAFRWTAAGGLQVLGTLGGTSSVAYDVAPNGRIVGASTTSTGETHAFIWWPEFDRMDDLGTLGGTESVALSTSNVVVVGYSTVTPGGPRHAIAWRTRTVTVRDQGTDGGTQAIMRAINNDGLVAGNVLDSLGASSRVHWQLTEVNTNPDVYFTAAPPTIVEGSTVTFGYGAIDDEDELSYRWDFGNGGQYFVRTATPPPVTRTYQDNGSYAVSVTVADPSAETDVASTTVVVTNRAPTGTFRSPASPVAEGSPFPVSVVGVSDAQVDRSAGIQASFNCGDGVWLAYSLAHSHTCTAPGTEGSYTVGVRLRDKDGAITQYTRPLTVINAPPTVVVTAADSSITLGQLVTVQGSFNDPGTGDGPFSFRIDWADGRHTDGTLAAEGAVPPVQHRYITAGTRSVRLSVTDAARAIGLSSLMTITVSP